MCQMRRGKCHTGIPIKNHAIKPHLRQNKNRRLKCAIEHRTMPVLNLFLRAALNFFTPQDHTMTRTLAAYGSWHSPINANLLTAQTVRIAEPHFDGDSIYWLESRPSEKGRNALVCVSPDGARQDLLPTPYSVRTRANEYGGGAYLVAQGIIYLVLDTDERVYHMQTGATTLTALSPEGKYRYADFCLDHARQRLICVREDHTQADHEARCEIIALAVDGSGTTEVLVSGADFYSNPRLSPEGTQLCWLSWNHPQMPWDGTECFVAHIGNRGQLEKVQQIAGSAHESIFHPQWSPNSDLIFVSDKNNWWNLYQWNGKTVENLCEMPAEFATPQWVFGMSTYGFLTPDTLLCCYSQNGHWQLASLNLSSKTLTKIATELTDISAIDCSAGKALLLGANPRQNAELYAYDMANETLTSLAKSSANKLDARYLSAPQAISYATSDGETAQGFYYPPHNPDFVAPPDTLPPLIVMCHGGPTAATEASLNLKVQYWTSRGFAVLDVNYRGSTGYGRAYRDRLKKHWGISDVIDVCSGADYLIQQGLVNAQQIAIRGSSAGGYTVLAALTFSDRFTAGASLYGIGNLETLAQDTHKFESRYLDMLVGAYPDEQAIYHARSPIHHIEKLNCPVIFLQGLEDKVVPPNQAEAMVDALTAKGIANAYVTFEEEGHGFRQAKNIERAIEAELFFYSQVFGFHLAETIEPVDIAHLELRAL